MPKIEFDQVKSFLDVIESMVYGMWEGVKVGDDGFKEFVEEQYEEIKQKITEFKVLHLTPLTPATKIDYVSFFLNNTRDYQMASDETARTFTAAESTWIYKGDLYCWFKRELGKQDYSHIKNSELETYIEVMLERDKQKQKAFYSNEWMRTSLQVLADIVEEIKQTRLKNPQNELFS